MKLGFYGMFGCVVLLAMLCACGTPGAPQLPSLQLARPVEDLTASRKGQHVQLDWSMPKKNTDRTLIKHPLEIWICRHEGTALMSGCTVIGKLKAPKPPAPTKDKDQPEPKPIRMHYSDTLPLDMGQRNPAGFVRYGIELFNEHGRSAGLSNQALMPVAPTIPPPQQLSADITADGVRLTWNGDSPPEPPAGLTYQYRIMRKPADAPGYLAVQDVAPSATGFYLDRTAGWEQKYDYRITSVTQVHAHGLNAEVEGDDSQPIEAFTKDIYPPAQPAGLQAVFSSIGQKPFIDLTWAPNTEGDLAGYNVFRRANGGEPQKLNDKPVVIPSFRDEKVEPGATYVYSVSAVDLRGNESPRSAETSESVPTHQ